MAAVAFHRVAKVYADGTRAVDDLTLEVEDREFVVIVGPSGSGKTTALRMVAGLEEISEGTIAIGGRVVNNVPSRDRNIAMVFQSYALYPHLSASENVAFGLKVKRVAPPRHPTARPAGGGAPRARRYPRPQAARALRRTTPTRRDGSRDRAQPIGLPDGRATL
jgi:ABC-type sugar transport system ATPase subunit